VRVDLGIWDRLSQLILYLLVASAGVAVVLWYLPLIRTNEAKRRQIYDVQLMIQREVVRSNALRAEIAAFEDPRVIEKLGREKLNLARSNEVIFRFEGPPPAAAPAER
jgi:cell division protein FtsB